MRPDLRDLAGIPFVDGGRDPAQGLDCWGLFRLAMQRFGHEVPDYALSAFATQLIGETAARELAAKWRRVERPEPGCAVCMALDPAAPGSVQHFGVYVGQGLFIHCLEKTGSILSHIGDKFWAGRIKGYYTWNA
ncbi:NlpC/P60 family protein [Desulfocurvibacter africanus]|uniref:NlpC/P60 family protein n=1 Tax=Desulfocurvibacter africanus TaxID=873 RepID=UPI0004174B4C|nr:NlpC/P60 family protein [Desulfocurvibacter africanus]